MRAAATPACVRGLVLAIVSAMPAAAADTPEPTSFSPESTVLEREQIAGDNWCVDFSPDGRLITVGSGRWDIPGGTTVWNRETGRRLYAWPADLGIASAQISPDGKRVASSGWNRKLDVRSLSDGSLVFSAALDDIARLAWSPDGKRIATAAESGRVQLWDSETGEAVADLKGDSVRFHIVRFSPDGRFLAVGGGVWDNNWSGQVNLWDVESGEQIRVLRDMRGPSRPVLGLAFTPDGKTLLSGGLDHLIRKWDVDSGEHVATLSAHENWVEGLDISPDGKLLATVGHDQQLIVWNLDSGDIVASRKPTQQILRFAVFSPDGRTLATSGEDRVVRFWNTTGFEETGTLPPKVGPEAKSAVRALAIAAEGRLLAVGRDDGGILLVDSQTGQLEAALEGHAGGTLALAFSADGRRLASAGQDGHVRVWDVATSNTLATIEHPDGAACVAFAPDGRTLASGGFDRHVRLWSAESGEPVAMLEGHAGSVRGLAFSPDGKQLVSASSDRTARVWNIERRETVRTLEQHTAPVRAAAWSAEGLIATGGEDDLVCLWNAESGELARKLTANQGMVWDVEFSPAGKTLATVGLSNSARLWDPETGRERQQLDGHESAVTCVVFRPAAAALLTGSFDKSIRVWPAQPVNAQPAANAAP